MYFSQSQTEISTVFSLVNFECLTSYCTAWNSTFSHACAGCHQSGVYGDMHLKQWGVIGIWFLMTEKESIINIHKQLKKMYPVSMLIKTLLVIGLYD